jgi:hypothetical protein
VTLTGFWLQLECVAGGESHTEADWEHTGQMAVSKTDANGFGSLRAANYPSWATLQGMGGHRQRATYWTGTSSANPARDPPLAEGAITASAPRIGAPRDE